MLALVNNNGCDFTKRFNFPLSILFPVHEHQLEQYCNKKKGILKKKTAKLDFLIKLPCFFLSFIFFQLLLKFFDIPKNINQVKFCFWYTEINHESNEICVFIHSMVILVWHLVEKQFFCVKTTITGVNCAGWLEMYRIYMYTLENTCYVSINKENLFLYNFNIKLICCCNRNGDFDGK